MATKNTKEALFSPQLQSKLAKLADKEHKTLPLFIKELVLEALENRQEEIALSDLAEKRDTKKQKTVSHEKAWK